MSSIKQQVETFLSTSGNKYDFSVRGVMNQAFADYQAKGGEGSSARFRSLVMNPEVQKAEKAEVKKSTVKKLLSFTPVKLENDEFTAASFVSLKTGKLIDRLFSDLDSEGGIVTGIYFVIGDPGVGKTTVLADTCLAIEKNNDSARTLFVNAEMSKKDFAYEALKNPALNKLNMAFMDDYHDYDPCQVLEMIFAQGYDVIVLDSWKSIQSRIKLFYQIQGVKMSDNALESWFLQVLKKYNNLYNTRFLIIQQINKDGSGAGSKALEHDTTGWMEIRHEKQTGRRKILFIKNRRNGSVINIPIYYTKDKEGEIEYDEKAFNDYQDSKVIQKQNEKELEEMSQSFEDDLYENGGANIDLSTLGFIDHAIQAQAQ